MRPCSKVSRPTGRQVSCECEAFCNHEGQKTEEYIFELFQPETYKECERMECECGSNIRKDGKRDHLKTLKHRNFINGIEPKKPLTEKEKFDRYYEYVKCPCGGSFRRHNKSKHFCTNQHKKWLVEVMEACSDTETGEGVPRFKPTFD